MNNLEKLNALYMASRKAVGFDADAHDALRKIAEELYAEIQKLDVKTEAPGVADPAPTKAKKKLAEVVPINT